MTTEYIFSQVFIVLSYLFLGSTYLIKNRKIILVFSFISLIANAISFYLLDTAISGFAMCFVAIFRNILLLVQNHFDKDKKNKIIDWSIFAILLIITGIAAWKTYINVLGLFSVFATFIYTVSIWQKNTIVYKILGIICSCFWIGYDIFVWSIFGIICEGILLISEIVGLILAVIKSKKLKHNLQANFNENINKYNIEK